MVVELRLSGRFPTFASAAFARVIMAGTVVWSLATLIAVCMLGCGGSEFRFGNSRRLPNLSGKWNVTANSTAMSQQFQGIADLAQVNHGLQGTLTNLFTYCAASATLGGVLSPNRAFDATAVNSYGVAAVLQEAVGPGSAPQAIQFLGSASADGTHMSGVYTADAGSCTAGDSGTWVANKLD